MNFVFVTIQHFNAGRTSTAVSLAMQLSKSHRVLFVNPPLQRREFWFGSSDPVLQQGIQYRKENRGNLEKINEKMWLLNPACIMESINWIPSTPLVKRFTRINSKRLALAIKEGISKVSFEQFILVNDKDIYRSFYLKELLSPRLFIYLDRDFTRGVPYWQKHGQVMEPELMRKADAIFCNSPEYQQEAAKVNKQSYYIGNGFDSELFSGHSIASEPEDLASIPHPRIGYIGAMVTNRLDIRLIEYIANKRENWSIALIGREDAGFRKSNLHLCRNIYFLGYKDAQLIPQYLNNLDVAINPQSINPITSGNFPLKIVEYLAMGLPVVATATSTMKALFSDVVWLAGTAEEFLKQIDKALFDKNQAKRAYRIEFVRKYSWEKVTENFLNAIESTLSKVKN